VLYICDILSKANTRASMMDLYDTFTVLQFYVNLIGNILHLCNYFWRLVDNYIFITKQWQTSVKVVYFYIFSSVVDGHNYRSLADPKASRLLWMDQKEKKDFWTRKKIRSPNQLDDKL